MAARRKAVGPPRVSSRKVAGPPSQVLEVLGYGIAALENVSARYCVVGGIARGYLAEARSTKDVDFAVSTESEDEVDRLLWSLQSSGFVVREIFQKNDGRVATARLTWRHLPVRMDLLFQTSGIERLVVRDAVVLVVLKGVTAPVIRRPHLIAMKLIAARDQDLIDIGALLDAASPAEVKEVEGTLEEIAPAKRKAAVGVWRALLKRREARKPDLFPAPARLKALQRTNPRQR